MVNARHTGLPTVGADQRLPTGVRKEKEGIADRLGVFGSWHFISGSTGSGAVRSTIHQGRRAFLLLILFGAIAAVGLRGLEQEVCEGIQYSPRNEVGFHEKHDDFLSQ